MRITPKRLIGAVAVPLLLILGVAAGAYVLMGGAGGSALENYIGNQVKSIVNGYLVPELAFDDLDYQAPKTVVLYNVRLTSPDPDRPGTSIDIFEAESLRIELAEIPRPGRPLVIKSVTLNTPVVRLMVAQADGKLIGFSQLVQAEPDNDAPPLSDVLQLRLIELRQAAISLDTRDPGTQPTLIDDITTDVLINPDSTDGWYAVSLQLDRAPVISAALEAEFNINTLRVEVESAEVGLKLNREQDRYLPQSIQAMIKDYDLTGDLRVTASGSVDVQSYLDSEVQAAVLLTDGHALVEEYQFPIDRLYLTASTAGRVLDVPVIELETLQGTINGSAAMRIEGDYPLRASLHGAGLNLQDLFLAKADGARPPVAGNATFDLEATALLSDIRQNLRGGGTLQITEGRIARIPVLSDIIDVMESSGDLSRPEAGAPAGRDKADIAFRLRDDHVYLSKAEIVGGWFAVRGRGNIFLDQRLALQVNAGPLEKVQDALGAVGDVLGALTDSVMAYRVGGTVPEPGISVVAFGGLRSAPGDDEVDPPPFTLDPPATGADEPAPDVAPPSPDETPEPRRPGPSDPDWEPAYDS